MDGYSVIWNEKWDYNTFWIFFNISEAVCQLTTDWKTDNMDDSAWGFFVSDPYGLCPYVESEGWTYTRYEDSVEGLSIWGPYGYKWTFTPPEVFYELIPNDDWNPSWYNYLTNDDMDGYAVIWFENDDLDTMWIWDESEAVCTLTTDWKTDAIEDGAWGFYVSDPDGTCPYVESEGWTYAWYTSDDEGNPLSIQGPRGNQWNFTEP
jgi:hypothetical protein